MSEDPEHNGNYRPISDYGAIGDTRGMALVNSHGGIDWCSLPYLDSPPFFLRLLDTEQGGYFSIEPTATQYATDRRYIDDTNVLRTNYRPGDGKVELTDCFVVPSTKEREEAPPNQLLRMVECLNGSAEMHLRCLVTPNYAQEQAEAELIEPGVVRWTWSGGEVWLVANWPLEIDADNPALVTATFHMQTGDQLFAVVSDRQPANLTPWTVREHINHAVNFWRQWVLECPYFGMHRGMVIRSALTLKLLTFRPTGAIVAAPTTSLPEEIGGERNWDYRYCWLRDASLTLWSFGLIGFVDEAHEFMHWIEDRVFSDIENIQIMYGIRGERDLHEKELDHLAGYRNSRPVRIGNGAHDQKQLDIYGEVMDTAYLFYYAWDGLERYTGHGDQLEGQMWDSLRALANQVVERWMEKDSGLWEVRGGPRHFVHSKVMCWVAMQRAIRLAEEFDLPADLDTWRETKDAIRAAIMERGYNKEIGAFTQSFDSDVLDASVLLMPMVHFIKGDDPKMLSTIRAIEDRLCPDGLVYRYLPHEVDDGLEGREGAFTLCSFWMVDNLVFAGRLADAREMFSNLIDYGNDLGLFSEEINPETGEFLGNFPQAFTHMALINAAVNIDRAERRLQEGHEGPLRPGVKRQPEPATGKSHTPGD